MPVDAEVGRIDLPALAVALTGDPRRAARLMGEVQVLTGSGPDSPDRENGLALLVAHFLRTCPERRGSASDPAEETGGGGEQRTVQARIDALPPLPRAALVLRHRAGLTLREVAALLDRPVPRVARLLRDAEEEVGAELFVVAAALGEVAPVPPAAVEAAAQRFRRVRRRRRSQIGLAVVTALALLAAVTVVPGVLERRNTFVRAYGAWVHGFDLEPGSGWRSGGRTLTVGRDSMTVYRGSDDRAYCLIDLVTSEAAPAVPEGDPVRVQGRPGLLVRSSAAATPYLWWAVGPQTTAVIGCSDESDPKTLLSLAGRVRLRAVPMLLPFSVGAVGDDVAVRFAATRDRAVVALSLPPGEVSRAAATVYISVPGSDRIPEDRWRRRGVNVLGRNGTLDRGRNGGVALCWPVQASQACVSSYVFRESSDPQQTRLRSRVTAIAAGLRFAPRLDEPSTWFDAAAFLPR